MPSVAATYNHKRILSQFVAGNSSPRKKQRVRFADKLQVIGCSQREEDEQSALAMDNEEEEEDVEFVLTIGEDGDIDFTITTKKDEEQQSHHPMEHLPPFDSPQPTLRPTSPLAESDCQLSQELYSSSADEDELCTIEEDKHTSSSTIDSKTEGSTTTATLKISLEACNRVTETEPMPLITPPASPRRVRTFSLGGVPEDVTICEWPCNLAVDNAITAALEDASLVLPFQG